MATIERGELLSKQVEEALRERIREGCFTPGEQLPPENDLAASYGVSRATVRAALANLQREGTVVRRQGSGTYVTHAATYLDSRMEEMWNCEDMIRALGCQSSIGWLEYEESLPDARARQKLRLGPTESVLVVRKVFLADGEPVIHCADYIPRALIKKPFTRDDLSGNVFDFLEESAGERATYYVAELIPTVAEGSIARRLECSAGTPLLLFDEVAYNIKDRAISCSLLHHRREGVLFRVVQSRP
ncbi:MAG TPA: GntR family transcriptional regulator [Anaerolineae bacterium]|nr:GntR family transcriptional regulator [Anaerolineae bacterium]HUW96223.1 GntR family transcriptional regulator [Anaerolineae bacterium]